MGAFKWGLKATLCNSRTIVYNCALLWPFWVPFWGEVSSQMATIVGNCGQLWTSSLSPPLLSPHLDFPEHWKMAANRSQLFFSRKRGSVWRCKHFFHPTLCQTNIILKRRVVMKHCITNGISFTGMPLSFSSQFGGIQESVWLYNHYRNLVACALYIWSQFCILSRILSKQIYNGWCLRCLRSTGSSFVFMIRFKHPSRGILSGSYSYDWQLHILVVTDLWTNGSLGSYSITTLLF